MSKDIKASRMGLKLVVMMKSKTNKSIRVVLTTIYVIFLLSSFIITVTELEPLKADDDIAILKDFSNDLEEGWPQMYDGGGEDVAMGATVDSTGNITVTGYSFNESLDRYNFLTIKYGSDGNEIWQVPFDSRGHDAAVDIAADSQDNLIVLGFNGTTLNDFNNLTGNIYVVKYNNNGVEQWNLSFHMDIYIFPSGIVVDSNDNIIITGWTGNALTKSCWTIKMDGDGTEIWNETYHEDMEDYGVDIAVDSNDDIVIEGFYFYFKYRGYK